MISKGEQLSVGRQHLNFYLTTITKTVLSFCFCTLELVYIHIHTDVKRIMCRGDLYLTIPYVVS